MAQTRFTCTLTRADEPECQSYARVRTHELGRVLGRVNGHPFPRSHLTATMTATAPNARAISANLGYVRPENGRSAARLQPPPCH
jgi:hypothetical protein